MSKFENSRNTHFFLKIGIQFPPLPFIAGILLSGWNGSSVCFGHGVCDGGSLGTGQCICQPGYAGPDCGVVCRGGPQAFCSGHGACSAADGSCICQDSAAGHFTGLSCERCVACGP